MSWTGGLGSRFGALAARLALAFVVVALVAIGLLAGLTIVAARSSVDNLVAAQRAQSIPTSPRGSVMPNSRLAAGRGRTTAPLPRSPPALGPDSTYGT